jgi:hypothetical protein
MTTTEMIVEKVKELVAPLGAEDRLRAIEAIAEMDAPDNGAKKRRRSDSNLRSAQMQQEQDRWFAQPSDVRRPFHGRFIAVRNGEVIDQDADQSKLVQRVRSQFGDAPIPILNGDWDETPMYTFHSTHLER